MSDYSPTRPEIDQFLELYTFRDAVDHVVDAFNDETIQGRAKRNAMRAVTEAYRDLPNYSSWSYLTRRGQIRTNESQVDGTIEYDHTGGTSERLVTLTGSTFPTYAQWCRLLINTTSYQIAKYLSTTEVQLAKDSNPGADMASGTQFTLYRSLYPLPIDFRKGTRLQQSGDVLWPVYCEPTEALRGEWWSWMPCDPPRQYSMRTAPPLYSGFAVEFSPPPSMERTYDFMYTASPRVIRPFGTETEYTTGTITGISSTTVTGSGTTWTSRMVGSVLRFGTDTVLSPGGYFNLQEGADPFAEQRVVIAVTSATELEIDTALVSAADYADTNYSIGDPIDLDPSVMYAALLYLAEANYARLIGRDTEEYNERLALAYRKVNEAKGADYKNDKVQEDGYRRASMTIQFRDP